MTLTAALPLGPATIVPIIMQQAEWIAEVRWPEEALGDAAAALLAEQGWGTDQGAPAGPVPHIPTARNRWLAVWARRHGVEVDPVETAYSDVESFLKGVGPALVCLPAPHAGVLAVLKCRGRSLWCLAPDGTPRPVPLPQVERLFLEETDGQSARAVDALLEGASLDPTRRAAVHRALLNERFAGRRLQMGWILRVSPAAPLTQQAKEAGLPALTAALILAQLGAQLFVVLSWLTVGDLTVHGQLDWGAANVWSLLLLSAIPFHALGMWSESVIALKLGALFKRRLLYGLLGFESDESRRAGAGQMMCLAMEADALETASQAGGLLALLAVLRLSMALVILATFTESVLVAAALFIWVAIGFTVMQALWRRTHEWAVAYRGLGNDLVEKMTGHRTYVAQLHPADWHRDEDPLLVDYWRKGVPLDRHLALIVGGLARGWLVAGGAVTAVVLWRPDLAFTSLALVLLAVLIAYQAFEILAHAAPVLIQLVVAWREIAPLIAAGSDKETAAEVRSTPLADVSDEADSLPRARRTSQDPVMAASQLTFSFPRRGRPVLNSVYLRIFEGDRLLLEGPSGGGKSTLAAVLSGARRASAGRLLLGGRSIEQMGADLWRRRVLCVPQFHENHVFTGTFAFNLLLGRQWPPGPGDLENAAEICRELGLGPLLEHMPDGMQQMVGESGWMLSHGERSRLFIARALLQDADLIILDESFAALDPESTEHAFACVLQRARTVMVIAHP